MLPPSFSGRYDKERFAVFLETNLRYLGYVGIIMSIVLFVLVRGGGGLGARFLRRVPPPPHPLSCRPSLPWSCPCTPSYPRAPVGSAPCPECVFILCSHVSGDSPFG